MLSPRTKRMPTSLSLSLQGLVTWCLSLALSLSPPAQWRFGGPVSSLQLCLHQSVVRLVPRRKVQNSTCSKFGQDLGRPCCDLHNSRYRSWYLKPLKYEVASTPSQNVRYDVTGRNKCYRRGLSRAFSLRPSPGPNLLYVEL